MKRYILDYLSRWRWVFILGFFGMMVLHVLGMMNNIPTYSIPVAFYFGGLLLSIDLIRGPGKICYVLPVPKKSIGLAWWSLATWMPALFSSAVKLMAVWVLSLLGDWPVPAHSNVVFSSILDFLYANVIYFLYCMMASGNPGDAWSLRNGVLGGLYGLLISGWMIIPAKKIYSFESVPPFGYVLMGVATVIAIRVYWMAGTHARQRSSLRIHSQGSFGNSREWASLAEGSKSKTLATFGPTGFKGLLFATFRSGLVFGLFLGVVMRILMPMLAGGRHMGPVSEGSFGFENPGLAIGVFSGFLIINLIWQGTLRILRSMPLSANRIIAMMFQIYATTLLGFLTSLVIVGLFQGEGFPNPARLVVSTLGYLGVLSFAMSLWTISSKNRTTWFVLFLMPSLMAGITMATSRIPNLRGIMDLIQVALVPLAWWITHRAITRSSNAYLRATYPTMGVGGLGQGRA